jgi:hypothetical protein
MANDAPTELAGAPEPAPPEKILARHKVKFTGLTQISQVEPAV